MKAFLRSVRIAPKKANLVAGMVRGLTVAEARQSLRRTNKKAARIIEKLLMSAAANAQHNENQNPDVLIIKTLTVNKAQAYRRGVPMARGRVRPMRKFLSHISIVLGIADGDSAVQDRIAKNARHATNAEKSSHSSHSSHASQSSETHRTASQGAPKPAQSSKKSTESASKKAKASKDTARSARRSAASKSS